MEVTDAFVNDVLRGMGVDTDKKKPPHWIQGYYISKADQTGGKYPDGFICSRCGKKAWSKKESCDGCGTIMVNSDKILSDLQKVADVVEVKHGKWISHFSDLFPADSTQECSICHEHESYALYNENYCPNCGAKMDGGDT